MRKRAPRPVAFRAGNYGANDDTLRALAAAKLLYDTSFAPALVGGDCHIDLPATVNQPVRRHGVIEVPISAIGTNGGGLRHGQLTALSFDELTAAIEHAHSTGATHFTLVSRSFELISRDRTRANQIIRRRFDRLCDWIAATPGLTTGTCRDDPPQVGSVAVRPSLPPSRLRTLRRQGEQAIGNTLFGRS